MFYNFTTKAGPLHPLFVYSLSIALSVGQGGKEGQFLFIVLLRKVTMKEMHWLHSAHRDMQHLRLLGMWAESVFLSYFVTALKTLILNFLSSKFSFILYSTILYSSLQFL